MKNLIKNNVLILIGLMIISLMACNKNTGFVNDDDDPIVSGEFATGLTGEDDISSVPNDFRFGSGTGSLPSSVDLTNRFPPMGNQGAYGTCVAWAAGYNIKTALNAIDQGLQTSDLQSAARQTSPTDLFLAIPDDAKGRDCDGTSFEPAFDIMIQRGVANMQTAPYTNFGDCSKNLLDPSWAQDAAKNKVANYRKIDNNVNTFKTYLAEDRPILIGMFTAENFMAWRGEDVFVSQGAANTGQHGRHAMAIVGYDDSKGPRGAFKLVNSWGTNWGADGFIWVDYNLCVSSEFLMFAFVVNNDASDVDPDEIDPNTSGEFNLIPYITSDLIDENGSTNRSRVLSYNIYNLGNGTVPSSKRWSMVYLYYNAFNLNDYGVVLYDGYTDEHGPKGQDGPLASGPGFAGNWWTNVDLPGRSGMAETVSNNQSEFFTWSYEMPSTLNGYYYMVAITDPENVVNEANESNNYQFLTNEYGGPVYIENGIVVGLQGNEADIASRSSRDIATERSIAPADRGAEYKNAYSPKEISNAVTQKLKSGELHYVKTPSRKLR